MTVNDVSVASIFIFTVSVKVLLMFSPLNIMLPQVCVVGISQ